MQNLTYEQAKAAHERGEKVEVYDAKWWALGLEPQWDTLRNKSFRLADPCAHLKQAQSEGKVIQRNQSLLSEDWVDQPNPSFTLSPDRYRIKPELKIEAGKEYLANDGGNGDKSIWRVVCTDAYGPWPVVAVSGLHTERFAADGHHSNPSLTLSAPAPYDNWPHVPAWANWQAMDCKGNWQWFANDPQKSMFNWNLRGGGLEGDIPPEFAPTNHTGTWDQSLQPRLKL